MLWGNYTQKFLQFFTFSSNFKTFFARICAEIYKILQKGQTMSNPTKPFFVLNFSAPQNIFQVHSTLSIFLFSPNSAPPLLKFVAKRNIAIIFAALCVSHSCLWLCRNSQLLLNLPWKVLPLLTIHSLIFSLNAVLQNARSNVVTLLVLIYSGWWAADLLYPRYHQGNALGFWFVCCLAQTALCRFAFQASLCPHCFTKTRWALRAFVARFAPHFLARHCR